MDNKIYNKIKRKGWSHNENVREQFEDFTNKEVNEEIYGEKTNKRRGKKRAKDKPYKIFYRCTKKGSFLNKDMMWHQYYVGPFPDTNTRDHELEKARRGWHKGYYEFAAVDCEEDEKKLLEQNKNLS